MALLGWLGAPRGRVRGFWWCPGLIRGPVGRWVGCGGRQGWRFPGLQGRRLSAHARGCDHVRVTIMEHADYPHLPGTLYGCRVCESRCFCRKLPKGVGCVGCAVRREKGR